MHAIRGHRRPSEVIRQYLLSALVIASALAVRHLVDELGAFIHHRAPALGDRLLEQEHRAHLHAFVREGTQHAARTETAFWEPRLGRRPPFGNHVWDGAEASIEMEMEIEINRDGAEASIEIAMEIEINRDGAEASCARTDG